LQPREIDITSLTPKILLASTVNWPDKMLAEVGIELREGRKVQPIVEDTEGLSYDECIGIHYAPINRLSCGFRIKSKPRRIGVREVAKYALPGCKTCHGVGWWSVSRDTVVGADEVGRKLINAMEYEQSCPCAEQNYQQQNKHFLIDSQNGEWIALDDLTIEVEGDDVQSPGADDELRGDAGVPPVLEQG